MKNLLQVVSLVLVVVVVELLDDYSVFAVQLNSPYDPHMLDGGTIKFSEDHRLQCYHCQNALSNTLCNSDTLLVYCEEFFDTCQTTIFYSEISRKMTITKSCALNSSCWHQMQIAKDRFPCEEGSTSWICVNCCNYDKCNRDSATLIKPPPSSCLISTALTILIIAGSLLLS